MKTNNDMLLEMNTHVYGHLEAKKALITMVMRSQRSYIEMHAYGRQPEEVAPPMKLLLVAESGNGKTFLVESLRKIVGFPYMYIDATKLNPTGASGGYNEKEVREKITKYAGELCIKFPDRYKSVDGVLAQMVVFVDEMDKLGTSFESSGNWNTHTQSNFLTLFEDQGNLKHISWVFAGAFTKARKEKHNAVSNTKSIGFFNNIEKTDTPAHSLTEEDIVNAGIIPELLGRINAIITLDVLKAPQYASILITKLIPNKLKELESLGLNGKEVKLDVEGMAKKAEASGMGVRSLHRQLDEIYRDLEWEASFDMSLSYL